ncbi:uncharacterized protein CLUP02_12347 [Colletotrichum lupini]|uniref:Uncharacterized protein n=1 Tax=Colletotrichum lupini TaxID=145971 RepID=A0A9Q8T135_9PEZI|nr:uncharacterized protein CLUP02_12347 [Colletotrichum lupini]UQC86845.1 hypothetical protein CLUP02_12347 [Colletotrichum lupini]
MTLGSDEVRQLQEPLYRCFLGFPWNPAISQSIISSQRPSVNENYIINAPGVLSKAPDAVKLLQNSFRGSLIRHIHCLTLDLVSMPEKNSSPSLSSNINLSLGSDQLRAPVVLALVFPCLLHFYADFDPAMQNGLPTIHDGHSGSSMPTKLHTVTRSGQDGMPGRPCSYRAIYVGLISRIIFHTSIHTRQATYAIEGRTSATCVKAASLSKTKKAKLPNFREYSYRDDYRFELTKQLPNTM